MLPFHKSSTPPHPRPLQPHLKPRGHTSTSRPPPRPHPLQPGGGWGGGVDDVTQAKGTHLYKIHTKTRL